MTLLDKLQNSIIKAVTPVPQCTTKIAGSMTCVMIINVLVFGYVDLALHYVHMELINEKPGTDCKTKILLDWSGSNTSIILYTLCSKLY